MDFFYPVGGEVERVTLRGGDFCCRRGALGVGDAASAVDGFAVQALDEIGIDVRHHHAKTFDDVDPSSFDVIVTLSPEAHHQALEFTRGTVAEVEYWPVPDPSVVEGSREMRLDAYRRLRDMILMRLKTRFGAPAGPTV